MIYVVLMLGQRTLTLNYITSKKIKTILAIHKIFESCTDIVMHHVHYSYLVYLVVVGVGRR